MERRILGDSVLVGRQTELALLQESLDVALRGKGATVFVSGEAGSGKTRLTNEFLETAKGKGVTVLSGWCLCNAAVPYFPFVEAFESHVSEIEESRFMGSQQLTLKALLTEPNSEAGVEAQLGTSLQTWKDRKFASVAKGLLYMSSEKPIILFIDDLHWADSASLALLHYVARAITSERILIVATFRNEELGSSLDGFSHPLIDTLLLMGREDLFREVKLGSLSQNEIGKIAANMLNGKISQELLERLTNESLGNPLFAIESLRMLYENGSLIERDGCWQLAVDKIGIPFKVKDVILHRLIAMKPNQRRTLDVASVIGDKFDPKLLGAVLNQDSLEVLETLNSIALSKSLVCVEGDYYRFDHAKSREVLYDEILLPLKNGYHERVAERIETINQGAKILPLGDLAYHYNRAGNKPKLIEYNLAAGKDALTKFSDAEAIRYFIQVINTVGESPEYSREKIDATEGLGNAYFARCNFEEAIKTFEKISETAVSDGSKLRALRKAVVSCYWRGDSSRALELAANAQKLQLVDRLEYARLQLYKGFVAGRSFGKIKEALDDMSASLRVFEEENSLPDVAMALTEISFAYPWAGRLEDSLSAALRAVAIYEELGDERQQGFAIGRLGSALGTCGFFKEAIAAFSKANIIEEKIGDYNAMAFHCMMSGLFYEFSGNMKPALIQSEKGLELAERTDAQYVRSLCYANLVRENSWAGEIDRAEEFYKKLEKLLDEVPSLRSNLNTLNMFQYCTAILLGHKGEWTKAIEILQKQPAGSQAEKLRVTVWVLEKLGRIAEAKKQLGEFEKECAKMASRFSECNVQGFLLAPKEVCLGEEFDLRLDVVNVGKKGGNLIRIDNLAPDFVGVSNLPPSFSLHSNSAVTSQMEIGGLESKILKIRMFSKKIGDLVLKPQIICEDQSGETKMINVNQISVAVNPTSSANEHVISSVHLVPELQFESQAAQKIFDFLAKSFNEDCLSRIPVERAGWRTQMDIVKRGKVSKYSVYGTSEKRGRAISELERNCIVETRVFTGERGRGGEILKVRIAFENESVRKRFNEAKAR